MFHISLSKLCYDINYKKKPQNSYFIQFYYHILFKAQEYLCLAIFEKPVIQVHGKTILSIEFKSMIKTHDLNSWQFIYPKPNSHWQHQNPIFISNIKAQFLLAISKTQLTLALFKTQVSLANIKTQFSLATLKAQFTLALFKTQFSLAKSKPNSY